jgi:hypothetical protein
MRQRITLINTSNNSSCVRLGLIMCLAILSVAAVLIGSAGAPASGQTDLVRVVSPADMILQPTNAAASTSGFNVQYDPRVAYVLLTAGEAPLKLTADQTRVNFNACGLVGTGDLPDELLMHYDAFDSGNAKIGSGYLNFKIGPDTTKPAVRIVSPKNGTLVGPGEAIEIVVVGEESKTAQTWQRGMRRLTLTDSQDTQTSPQTVYKACDNNRWTSEHHFRYVVPRNAEGGQIISLTAGAEDWAKNIGFAPLDLIVQEGFTGVWTSEVHFLRPSTGDDYGYGVYAAFSFTLSPYTGAVQCGSQGKPYCGMARVSYLPGRAGGCNISWAPAGYTFKIVAHGVRQGSELKGLNIKPAEKVPTGFRSECPGHTSYASGGTPAIGPFLPDGITIALPLGKDHTTVTKDEKAAPGWSATHKVELYAPRQNR